MQRKQNPLQENVDVAVYQTVNAAAFARTTAIAPSNAKKSAAENAKILVEISL
jgi:hypothetical protein